MHEKKILFTSVCQPLGEQFGDRPSVGYELLHGQVTRAQGMFSPRALHLHFALEYIAENLETPSVVLQYPTKKQLIRELKKGYDYVGVSFLLAVFHRMKDVVKLIRTYAPQSKIILGGYGTVLSDEELAPYSDYICRGEGVSFVRELLNEPALPTPYKHPLVVSRLKVFSTAVSETGMIFAGLGCPNGCDFCCTSHFFKRRHVKLLPTGRDIFDVIERYLELNPNMSFVILDEDFLLNKKRAMELRDCILKSGKTVSMFAFSSVRAISQYSVEEILEMGIDGFWIGYEGTRSNYAKQQGRPIHLLFQDLREHGVTVLASMIVGFPYQTKEIIEDELSALLAAKPVLSQFLIYGPTPGTPFYDRIMKEDLLHKDFADDREKYYRNCTGFSAMVKHATSTKEEIEQWQRDCFEGDFQRLGPSIYRSIETTFQGYKKLIKSSNPYLKQKAEHFAKDLRRTYPICLVGKILGPNKTIRRKIATLETALHKTFGKPTLKERLLSGIVVCTALWTSFKLRHQLFQHPKSTRHAFRMPTAISKLQRAWKQLAKSDLPLTIEQRSENTIWLRFDTIFSAREAKELGNRIQLALKRGKGRLVLDMALLKHLEGEAAKHLALSLQEFRERIRLVIPSDFTNPEVSAWLKNFSLYHQLPKVA